MSVPTCIYCDSKGPFSEEHVVPAGLGGGDKNWLLKDCVCAKGNTMVFSPLEAKFLRTSPIAFARLFRQPNTRKNSRSGGMPSLQTLGSDVRDQATGVLIEIELMPGGRPSILPQVLLVYPDRFSITGPDEEQTRKFIAKLLLLLGPSVHLVRKLRERPARFEVRTLTWGHEGRVSLSDIVLMTKPPKDAVWIEELSN